MGIKTFYSSSWLGWQIESNWTKPFFWFLYTTVKPIFSVLILVFMYFVVTGGKTKTELFHFMFLGNAFYMLILGGLSGISSVIHEDREHYQALRYIYISPSNIFIYLAGRGSAKMISSFIGCLILLIFGFFVFKIPIKITSIDYFILILTLFLGILGVWAFGIILAAISMLTAMHRFFVFNEALGGIIYFLCGVLFPLGMLPDSLKVAGKMIPFTYFLELARKAILPALNVNTTLQKFSNFHLIIILTLFTSFLLLFSFIIFFFVDFIVRKKGSIDITTAH